MPAKKALLIGIFGLSISGSTLAANTECESNFASSGNFFSGKQYTTSVSSSSISKDDAYTKAYAAVVKGGYQVVSSDKDVGAISAAQSVSYSEGGKSAPLNLLVEAGASGGSKLTLRFSTAGGLAASSKAVIQEFCRISTETFGG